MTSTTLVIGQAQSVITTAAPAFKVVSLSWMPPTPPAKASWSVLDRLELLARRNFFSRPWTPTVIYPAPAARGADPPMTLERATAGVPALFGTGDQLPFDIQIIKTSLDAMTIWANRTRLETALTDDVRMFWTARGASIIRSVGL